jgi:hypothetical protein
VERAWLKFFKQGPVKNAGHCEAIPASGYQNRFDFVPTFFKQSLLEKIYVRSAGKILSRV